MELRTRLKWVPEGGFPKTVGKPVECFDFLFVWTNNREAVRKGFFFGVYQCVNIGFFVVLLFTYYDNVFITTFNPEVNNSNLIRNQFPYHCRNGF